MVSLSDQAGSAGGVRSGPALTVDRLTKRFGNRVAFEHVSFELGYGEVFGFLGPNGAGKTTTVRTLGTLIAPTSGSATVAGIRLRPENGVANAPERIERALRSVNLIERSHEPCGTHSKGLAQRVALARALLSEPEVLFLDEPTSGLDPLAARDVHELIAALGSSGVTIFLTTHRLEEAERLCDRVAILNTTLRTVGRPQDLRDRLFAKTLTVRTRVPLSDPGQVFEGLPAVEGWSRDGTPAYIIAVSDPGIAAPAVTRALVQAGADVLSIGESRHSLEDIYLELIDEDVEAGRRPG